ncbi:MAG: cbb3-type cytochrome oxidase assembly protein CcoS [Rhodobacteraceae bacterium]|nr:cbb3-type cytochrome oxidase assembly protein CcoS [Paracoccaceae bacterium]
MDVLIILIPASLFLGLLGLAAFYWTLKRGMYDDPEGDSRRILNDEFDDKPKQVDRPANARETGADRGD